MAQVIEYRPPGHRMATAPAETTRQSVLMSVHHSTEALSTKAEVSQETSSSGGRESVA
jgi:hypothetical protein